MIDAAIVGLGRWGQSIVNAVQGKSRLRFVRGVTKEPELARALATRHGFALSSEFAEAVADPAVRAVVLATPHSLHVDQVIAVARAGKPVWCEKPLALTHALAARAVAACEAASVPLAVGQNKRFFPAMLELARLVAAGEIGEVMHVEGHFSNEHSTRVAGGWRDDPAETPGAGMTGAGLHVLDSMIDLAGPARAVHAKLFGAKPPPDPRDAVAVLVEFASGATGTMATVRAAPMVWHMHVFGTRGRAAATGETTLTLARIGEAPHTRTFAPADSLFLLAEAFADAIEGRRPFPVTPPAMLATVAAFEAVIASLATGGSVAVSAHDAPAGPLRQASAAVP
ncbi:MAG: Gfo/Idh/MocA family oxidoreductase [Burkholderiales bacterium]|nr:Gfo/Idh/MocA family oxidoreductase [Burkholderiales bacterium]